jgi:hypothetical protein
MYQTAKELHIALNLALQYLNSNKVATIKPHEKDWIINDAIYEFIDNSISDKIKEGFDNTLLRFEDIEELKSSKLYLNINYEDETRSFVVIPNDFLYLVKGVVKVEYSCDVPVYHNTTNNVYVSYITLDSNISTPFFNNFSIEYLTSTDVLIDSIVYPNPNGYASLDALFMVLNNVIARPNNSIDIYYERYDNIYKPNTLIFVKRSPNLVGKVNIKYNGLVLTNTFEVLDYTISDISNDSGHILNIPCRNANYESIDDMQRDYYERSKKDSPLLTRIANRIYLYSDGKFNINELQLHYIKKPILINSEFDIMTDLKRNGREIVNIAVRKIKAYIDDVNYKNIIQENLLSKL